MPIDRKYTGYRDTASEGYTGIRSAIDYAEPQSVCNQTNTWIGTDNVSDMIWVQIGWAYEVKPSKRVANYAEIHRYDGDYSIYYFTLIDGRVTYMIEKDSGNAVWSIAGREVHSESWSGIVGTKTMPNAQYTVEVFEPTCDYVPGSRSTKNYYNDIQTRVTDKDFENATLATDQTNDPNGGVEKNTGAGNMWMAVWDKRAGPGMRNDGAHSVKEPLEDATPSVTWRAALGADLAQSRAGNAATAINRHIRAGINAQASAPASVEVSDAFSFGAPDTHLVHQMGLADIIVVHEEEGTSASVNIDLLLDPVTQGIVSVATHSKPQWAKPTTDFPAADPEAELEKVGITALFDPEARPSLKVEDVLAAIWRDMGISPEEAGQVVMRPRVIAPSYPKTMKNGQMVPERPAGLYWIVEVRGTVIRKIVAPNGEHIGHQTGMVILVDDRQGDAFYGIGLP